MSALTEMGKRAKEAAVVLATLPSPRKNKALLASADALLAAEKEILAANAADVAAAEAAGVKGAFIDRLTLTVKRIAEMADGLRQVAALDDPVGEMLSMKTLDNGLIIGQKRVPMGVIGIIFEARPNVAADAFGLCLKAGSAAILRGGKEAFGTNQAVVAALRGALAAEGLPEGPFLEEAGTIYYGLTVDPIRGDVYVADAIDYQQPGMICRYSAGGKLIDRFYAGITPGAFCWWINGGGR